MKCYSFIATSVDGFIARKDGAIDWLNAPEDLDMGFKNFFSKIDILIMGRNSYEKCLTFEPWPYATKKVIVLTGQENPGFELPKCTLVAPIEFYSLANPEHSLPALLQSLLGRGFQHAYIDGGKTIQAFIAQKLLNEITITQIPIILGSGIPLFDREATLSHNLKIISTATFLPDYVQVHYGFKTDDDVPINK